jgi:hypothetical protein
MQNIPARKAISQYLMHATLSVTEGVYGILSDMDVKQKISALGKDAGRKMGLAGFEPAKVVGL